ncbi:unnamed protein product, partial [Mesorhabditis belari]|uniref:Uncharacterized protein n=1 Tax=Mesorhabditis belari TaxID=2138241 RepID=A0AAF3EF21_9BILA
MPCKEWSLSCLKSQFDTLPGWGKAAVGVAAGLVLYIPYKYLTTRPRKSPYKEDYKPGVVYLYQFYRTSATPNVSNYCLKLETWLRMADIHYEIVPAPIFLRSKEGTMPFVELDGIEYYDSAFTISNLTSALNKSSLEDHLTDEQKAVSRAFEKMTENSFNISHIPLRLEHIGEIIATLPNIFGFLRPLVGVIASRDVSTRYKAVLAASAYGKHTREETIIIGCDDLKAISTYLGNKHFFTGFKPTRIDACLFGFLSQIVYAPYPNEHTKYIQENAHNLIDYVNRIKARFWPDWEECTKNFSTTTKKPVEPVILDEKSKYTLYEEADEETTTHKDSDYDGIPDFDEGLYTNVFQGAGGSLFTNQSKFSCPKIKPDLHTGDTIATLSPEDIEIIAAMGGSIAAGRGLWDPPQIEFRGASFAIGGDASIDGLLTIPNILLQFNGHLQGFNVAESGAMTEDLPQQAHEVVGRLRGQMPLSVLSKRWVLLIIQIGTEEMCSCHQPSMSAMRHTLGILRKGIPRCLVVIVGPIHIASSYSQNVNILKGDACKCLNTITKSEYVSLVKEWHDLFHTVQDEINNLKYPTFGVLAMTQLNIHSRDPKSLIVEGLPLLNRKGHTYAAQYVWNRLMMGPKFDVSEAVFSRDGYYCPSIGCPYFRTPLNFNSCTITTEFEFQQFLAALPAPVTMRPTRVEAMQKHLGTIIIVVVLLCFLSVTTLGTVFYCHGLKATKGRFESVQGV